MKSRSSLVLALILLPLLVSSCVGLDYPDYWELDDNLMVNVVTLPFEVLVTPIIFVIKLLPVL